MQTPGHIIINLGLLGGRDRPHSLGGLLSDRSRWTWPIIIGALIPDVMMFWFYFWTKAIQGLSESEIWREAYYLPGWQDIFDVFNSIPLALLGMGLAIYWKRQASQGEDTRSSRWASKWAGPVAACFASIILHCIADLPLHHDDGHRHFWPLSHFRFESPVSYWDPNHNAVWGSLFEVLCVLGATVLVLRWSKSRWGKGLLLALAALYVVLYTAFYGSLLFNPAA